jgi:tetratricopeptide (TPR) repeat protein
MNDSTSPRHYWIRGGVRGGRQRVASGLALPPCVAGVVDCHRRLRGPYTGAGTLARAITPDVVRWAPELVRRYDIELLSVAPELSTIVPNSRETLTSMAIPTERTRFYARLRTRRIANGLVEFIRAALAAGGAASLVLENVDHADETDLEFLASALRRIDPAALTIVVCSGARELPGPVLAPVLGLLAVRDAGGPGVAGAAGDTADPAGGAADPGALAWAYVWSDCTSDNPAQLGGYQALEPGERAALHEERAAALAGTGELSLRLGAVPYHLARGTDPAGAGAQALQFAQDHCVCMGFYSAAVELGQEGLWIVDPATQHELWWKFVVELGLALSVLSRTHEALRLYDTARLLSADPAVHMAAAYSTAMLYTRHNDPAERDEKKAKAWLNSAIATASLISGRADRAFQSAFYRNGLALVEVNLGEPAEALRLVNESIAILDQQLTPDEHRLHRSVLKNNRARVLAGLGRLDEALADYAAVIADDPNHAEHYLERGNIMRRLGRDDEAFADYATAMKLSPPFPEIYYNRGDLRLDAGDREGALADFSYVLELDPERVEAYLGRAGIYLEDGDVAAAEADVLAGLHCDAGNAYLQALLGQVCLAKGNVQAAIQACGQAIAADPGLQEAWACQAEAFFETGDHARAVTSLDRALETGESAPLLFNRSTALQAAGRWAEALADLERASELEPEDGEIAESLARCRERLARSQAGQRDQVTGHTGR